MKKIKIGILGYGTIGRATAALLKRNKFTVRKVCDVRKLRIPFPFTRNPYEVINDPEISIMIEAIGGERPALNYILAAIKKGKHVVTTNKEVIALHMQEILSEAAKKGVKVLFEGAVGGGIPILGALRNDLAGNAISEVFGIVNGTTNYILSKMTEEGMEFSEALRRAKEKGYAEANPKKDVEGYDASYKAAILASIAFSAKIDWKKVYFEGISKIAQEDIRYADEIGYVIKLLAITKHDGKEVEVRVHPTLIPKEHPLAFVSGPMNAIYVKGDAIGEMMFYGQGAGGSPTASAVLGDVNEIVKSLVPSSQFPVPNSKFKTYKIRNIAEITSRYYIRLTALDKHGVLAGISKAFADAKVSIAGVKQKETKGKTATIIIVLHEAVEKNVRKAVARLKRLSVVKQVNNVIRVGL